MSLSTDALLFGIALIAFGNWVEVHGLGGWPFADAGIVLAAIAFLGSVVSAMLSSPSTSGSAPSGD